MSVDVNIRDATARDGDRLVAFVEEYYAFDGIPFHRDLVAPAVAEMLADERLGRAWLVENAGEAIGYGILTFGFDVEVGGRFGLVTDLYFRPAYQGKGLGRTLLAAIEAACRAAGAKTLQLESERSNHAAHGFYRRVGFEPVDRLPFQKPIDPR